jgi:DNA invertase Pin-like site-specific DNA recombinase
MTTPKVKPEDFIPDKVADAERGDALAQEQEAFTRGGNVSGISEEDMDELSDYGLVESKPPSFRKGMRCALLLRISRIRRKDYKNKWEEELQKVEEQKLLNQEQVLRSLIKVNGLILDPKHIYKEQHTGREGDDKREVFKEVLDAAAREEFDIILLWAADRLTREGGWKMIGYCKQLEAHKIKVYTQVHGWLDISNPFKELLVYTIGQMALIESVMISIRVRRARKRLEKAKRLDPSIKLGGKEKVEVSADDLAYIQRVHGLGYSYAQIADAFKFTNPKITEWVIKRALGKVK